MTYMPGMLPCQPQTDLPDRDYASVNIIGFILRDARPAGLEMHLEGDHAVGDVGRIHHKVRELVAVELSARDSGVARDRSLQISFS